jgi:hypothetical protein
MNRRDRKDPEIGQAMLDGDWKMPRGKSIVSEVSLGSEIFLV